MSDATVREAFAELSRRINAVFPPAPDTGYVGNRCGWYPEKPRRAKAGRVEMKRRSS